MVELETRAVELRAAAEAREVRGLAVPWDELADIYGIYREKFARGSLQPHPAGVKLYDQHRQIVGTVEHRDAEDGLAIVGTVANTRDGDDFLELARSGAIGHLSVGFEPRTQTIEEEPDDGGTPIVTRTEAILHEVSGVPFPAYAGASIQQVRSAVGAEHKREDTHMGDDAPAGITAEQVDELGTELRGEMAELGRRIDALPGELAGAGEPHASRFRTGGELLKALAAGDEQAVAELRAADGTGPADSSQAGVDTGAASAWISRPLRFVVEKRRIVNLFGHETLPARGNTVEYPKVAGTAGTVGEQASEGDALDYMEVELDTGSATVGTYGGYSSLTRQAIERGDPAYLSGVLRYQAIQYAKATNKLARTSFSGITGNSGVALTSAYEDATAADWIAAVIDAAAAIEDNSLGLVAEHMIVSRDVFKAIATLADSSNRPIFALPNGGQAVNVAGSAAPVTAVFNIAGLPGFVDPGLSDGTCTVASSDAMTTLESAGAPFRMQDDNILKLTRDFSLYGYATVTVNDDAGVTPIGETAA